MTAALENFRDEELASRARAGSAACFEEIVRRYQVPLVRFLAKRFPSRRDAEDILQETFVRAWQALHRYDEKYAFRTWLYTIAYRQAVSHGRQDPPKQAALEENIAARGVSPAAGGVSAAARGVSPAAHVQSEEMRHSIWDRARGALSEEQFMAMWLFYVDELPAGDIARILDRSWVSVKTLLHRARRKLAPLLADLAPGGGDTPAIGVTAAAIEHKANGAAPALKDVNGTSLTNHFAVTPLRAASLKAGDR
jgi:RNA polymerase sigma-70 factor (ECF subfamily)